MPRRDDSSKEDRNAQITHHESYPREVVRGRTTNWVSECKAQVTGAPVKHFTVTGRIDPDRDEAIKFGINAAHKVVDTYNATGRWNG